MAGLCIYVVAITARLLPQSPSATKIVAGKTHIFEAPPPCLCRSARRIMHVLCIGSDSQLVATKLKDTLQASSLRSESVFIANCPFGLSGDSIDLVAFFQQAQQMVKSTLGGACDGIVVSWNAERDSAQALFALTAALKPFQTRIYLALSNLQAAIDKAETLGSSPFDRIVFQTSLAFFQVCLRACTLPYTARANVHAHSPAS